MLQETNSQLEIVADNSRCGTRSIKSRKPSPINASIGASSIQDGRADSNTIQLDYQRRGPQSWMDHTPILALKMAASGLLLLPVPYQLLSSTRNA